MNKIIPLLVSLQSVKQMYNANREAVQSNWLGLIRIAHRYKKKNITVNWSLIHLHE